MSARLAVGALGVLVACGGGDGATVRDALAQATVEEDGAALVWEFEWTGTPRLLELEVEVGAGATARLHLDHVDPRTGDLAEAEPPRALAASDGAAQARVWLPERPDRVLRVAVHHDGSGGPALPLRAELTGDAPPGPPIVLVVVDTLSANHLSLHGYPRPTSPHLEALAEEAVVFDACKANAPWTLASFASMLTGLYPLAHKTREPGVSKAEEWELWELWWIDPQRRTLAESLRARGYRTGAVVDMPWLTAAFGVAQGFEVLVDAPAYVHPADAAGGLRQVRAEATAWLDGLEGDAPPFLFVHAFDVHTPYVPEGGFRDRFLGDEHFDPDARAPSGALLASWGSIPIHALRSEVAATEATPAEMNPAVLTARYDEEILMLDAELGLLLDDLRARGLYDEAVIVVTADHGESMTGHDRYFDHGVLYEDVAHVPLVVKLPHGEHGGRRVAEPVQLVDLLPTLLELAGTRAVRPDLHGRSLVPALRGETLAPTPIVQESGIHDQASIELDGWKLIRSHPRTGWHTSRITHPHMPPEWIEAHAPELLDATLDADDLAALQARFGGPKALLDAVDEALPEEVLELYDLASDPREEVDLAAAHPEHVRRLEALLDLEVTRRERARSLIAGRVGRQQEMSAAALDILRDVGYADDD